MTIILEQLLQRHTETFSKLVETARIDNSVLADNQLSDINNKNNITNIQKQK